MVNSMITSASLKAEFQNGVDEKGEMKLVTKSFGEMDPSALPENIVKTCKAFEGLIEYPLVNGLRTVVTSFYEV